MDIRPIRTDEDLANAIREIGELWGAENGSREGDRLDILITLVDRYENEHFPIDSAHPIDIIKTHMEMTGRSQADLVALIGSASRVSEVLHKRRALTLEMIHKLHKNWGIPAACLIVPYSIERSVVYPPKASRSVVRRPPMPAKKTP